MTETEQLTDAGRPFPEEVEVRTDELERPVIAALGDDLDELLDHLDIWSEAIIAAVCYPSGSPGPTTSAVGRTSVLDRPSTLPPRCSRQ